MFIKVFQWLDMKFVFSKETEAVQFYNSISPYLDCKIVNEQNNHYEAINQQGEDKNNDCENDSRIICSLIDTDKSTEIETIKSQILLYLSDPKFQGKY